MFEDKRARRDVGLVANDVMTLKYTIMGLERQIEELRKKLSCKHGILDHCSACEIERLRAKLDECEKRGGKDAASK